MLVLIDDTVFGGAREGILITENQIRSKAKFEEVDVRLLSHVTHIAAHGMRIRIDGHLYIALNVPDADELEVLFEVISEYLQETH